VKVGGSFRILDRQYLRQTIGLVRGSLGHVLIERKNPGESSRKEMGGQDRPSVERLGIQKKWLRDKTRAQGGNMLQEYLLKENMGMTILTKLRRVRGV